jgi:hypothetical protein
MEIISFVVMFRFFIAPHFQFQGVGQGMKQTYLYMWYALVKTDISCIGFIRNGYIILTYDIPELVVPIRILLIQSCC